MSRYFNSFMDNSSEALEHSWGTSPEAKAREKEYNHWYYQKHKDDIAELRKHRSAATNYYKQAQKSYDDSLRNKFLANKMYDKYTDIMYSGHAKSSDIDMLDKAQQRYIKMYRESESKSRKLNFLGDRETDRAKDKYASILKRIKNPTVIDLVEFYLDTTIIPKAKKSASKAARKAKKYATKAVSNAEKYVTKAASNAEKAANKAEKYANKAVKSVANKAKKYVVR